MIVTAGYLAGLWPQGRGQLRLERLPGPAVVVRDELGIPCVWGRSGEAGFFALGYLHAQDRLWQLELMRRAAWGELVRVGGEEALPLDLLHRRIGFYRQAFAVRSRLGETEPLLRAYAQGISAYIRAHPMRLPPEFLAARLQPALWQVEDVLAVGALVEWLALPCSLRCDGLPGDITLGDRLWRLHDVPLGLQAFLCPIEARDVEHGGVRRGELAWGAQNPQPWVEAGLVVGNGEFVRGWCVPGWPIPHIAATRSELRIRTPARHRPWAVARIAGWSRVLEFIHDDPRGPCDSVFVSGGLSAVAPAGDDGTWWVASGSPRLSEGDIARGLRIWFAPPGGAEDSLYYGSRRRDADTDLPLPPGHVHRAVADVILEPIVPQGLLGSLAATARKVRGPVVDAGCFGLHGTAHVPASVVVEWEGNSVRAVVMVGQSGVAGNPHRRDQHRGWSRGELFPRDMRFPDFSRGCALVPLLS
ncbi:MAG: penicillin acylase family protein [Candidatus Eisenbacteria bacterium]|nr:penicillin acylase family protein [Candidatus Eisenbacteria bacterium]